MKNIFFVITMLFCLTNIALFGQNSNAKKPTATDRIIKIDYTKSAGRMNTIFKECIGAGLANEGLRADWQQQLAMVKKECDFKYIRMHGLLYYTFENT